jgi:hypothetical protein
MGGFIGYGERGVWASNGERNTFLDWFAEHRCAPGDPHWEYCKSGAQRWSGACVELANLIPEGTVFEVSSEEYDRAAIEKWPDFARLLGIIESITRGEWSLEANDRASNRWRRA